MATKISRLHLAFDVGHSSIGWAVLLPADPHPEILGTGTVLFPADDCLASQRRAFRRQRRHIRATRQRIARMKILLSHLGVLTAEQLDGVTSSSPWKLAARVLAGGPLLSWAELWDVLRWYAHNRGYDGNRRWAAAEASADDAEDTEKVENARSLMQRHGKQTTAETYCAELKVDPLGAKDSSDIRFKGLNAAFPRDVVERELHRILQAHASHLPKADAVLERALLGTEGRPDDDTAWQAIPCPDLKLPRRFRGSLLLGQSVPRFDNRLIGTCPFTFQSVLAAELADGAAHDDAKHRAERMAKVPAADCLEFYRYRWAMTLANIRSDGAPLSLEHRQQINAQMQAAGSMTPGELKTSVRSLTGHKRDNLDNLLVHPDMKQSLVLDPGRDAVATTDVQSFWQHLPETLQRHSLSKLRGGKKLRLRALIGPHAAAMQALEKWVEAGGKKKRGAKDAPPLTLEQVLAKEILASPVKGRAPFARGVMQSVYDYVLTHTEHPAEDGGPLFRSEAIRQAQQDRAIDEQTNNHLVRHRLRILDRLHRDLVKEYAAGDAGRISRCIIEVATELRTFGGKTNKEIESELGQRLANFKGVVKKLEKDLAGTKHASHITPGLIRKGRIAEDLNWTCPYTGVKYDAIALADGSVFDKDHVIPYSQRPSNSLDSLVITFKWVNAMKGNRTATEFIQEFGGKTGTDGRTMLMAPAVFKKHAESLEAFKGHDDDKKRKKRRRELLLLERWEEKVFLPRDLTQTSQLVRLGAQALTGYYIEAAKKSGAAQTDPPVMTSLPGSVTGAVRKAWHLLGCLSGVCPEVIGADGHAVPKGEVRGLTHLHHALDACVMGLADFYFPKNDQQGSLWQLMVKRNLTAEEGERLVRLTRGLYRRGTEGKVRLDELPDAVKHNIREKLMDRRVVQHIPADLTGLKADQTVWRVLDPKDQHPSAQKQLKLAAKLGVRVPDPDDANEDQAFITCQKRREGATTKPGKCLRESRHFWLQYDLVAKSKLFGLQPKPGKPARLKALKAVKVISENFGVALTGNDGVIIRGYNIVTQLRELSGKNGGKRPPLLRKGTLISVPRGTYIGDWKIDGTYSKPAKGVLVKLALRDGTDFHVEDVRVRTLLKDGMKIQRGSLTGGPAPQAP